MQTLGIFEGIYDNALIKFTNKRKMFKFGMHITINLLIYLILGVIDFVAYYSCAAEIFCDISLLK